MPKQIDQIRYNRKQPVFFQGDSGDCMYMIEIGKVGIYVNYGQENQKCLTVLNQGDYFGEMGLIDHEPRSATAVALEDRTLLNVIDEDNFAFLLREKPVKVLQILQHMAGRLRYLTEDYEAVCRAIAACEKAEAEGKPMDREELKKYAAVYRNGAPV